MASSPEVDTSIPDEYLLRLLYCSKIPRSKSSNQIDDDIEIILRKSREENQRFGITGVLVTDRKMYSQVIEGPPPVIKHLIGRISCDDRHGDIKIVSYHNSQTRVFREWSMAFLATTRNLEAEDHIFPTSDAGSNILAISSFCSSVRNCLLEKAVF